MPWRVYASIVAAGDKIYAADRDGTVVAFANDNTLKVLSTRELGEAIDPTSAIAGDALYIKGETHLFCIAR
ncbi:MAG: PQQ-binding-like beta-propeller repeat protein [Planctomycetes bacterium]|nr:PQQ-binding-like beta-propeller repeat protein [Planctomycetota bacterium]